MKTKICKILASGVSEKNPLPESEIRMFREHMRKFADDVRRRQMRAMQSAKEVFISR